jgi:hypothetical protein
MAPVRKNLKSVWMTWALLWVAFNALLLVEGTSALSFLRGMGEQGGHRCLSLYGAKLRLYVYIFAVCANGSFGFGPLLDMYVYIFTGRRPGKWRYALPGALLLFWSFWIAFYMRMGHTHLLGFLKSG